MTLNDLINTDAMECARERVAERYAKDVLEEIMACLRRERHDCRMRGIGGGIKMVTRDDLLDEISERIYDWRDQLFIDAVTESPEAHGSARQIVLGALTQIAAEVADELAANYDDFDSRR